MTDKDEHLHHDCDCEECEEFDTITLTDEDGEEHEFLHLDTLEVKGETYFILVAMTEETEDLDEDEAIILKLGHDEEGNEMLLDIEDDEEWETVADAWNSLEEDEDE
ncbi:MAG: DUF1292 domain-containing protein [Peptococcaceae bacterium]|jgi:uncharacterized protein YrzB (UPF0473 family)|nr:DUF1292 domain-containing protein [Peptococcaceae bacterium]